MYALFKIKTLSHQDVNHINIHVLVQKHIHVQFFILMIFLIVLFL